jgi:hypothetical protein
MLAGDPAREIGTLKASTMFPPRGFVSGWDSVALLMRVCTADRSGLKRSTPSRCIITLLPLLGIAIYLNAQPET